MTRLGLIALATLLLYSATFAQQAPIPATPVEPVENEPQAAPAAVPLKVPSQRATNPFAVAPSNSIRTRQSRMGLFPSVTVPTGPWRAMDPRLVSELAKAKNDAERKKIEDKIRGILSEEFDKQAVKEEQKLNDLQARIERVQQRLKNRIAGKSLLVDMRLQQMLDQADRVDTPIAASTWMSTLRSKPTPAPGVRLAPPALPATVSGTIAKTRQRTLVSSKTEVEPGDILLIENRADKSTNRRVKVLADNTIQIPLLGFVSVKGMSTTEIQKTLNEKAAAHYSDPSFEVFLSGVSEPIGKSDDLLR